MKIHTYSLDQAWVIGYMTVLIFLLSLRVNDRPGPLPSHASSVYEISGLVKNPGFYTCDAPVPTGEALRRAGGTTGPSSVVRPELFSSMLSTGSTLTVTEDATSLAMMETEKLILFFIPIDLNRAHTKQLEAVPGIGAKLARNIIDRRTALGAFTSLQELTTVSGIGTVKFTQTKDYFTIDNGSSAPSSEQ